MQGHKQTRRTCPRQVRRVQAAWKLSGAVALLEFFAAAAWARIVAANVFQFVAHGLLGRVAAMRAMYVTVVVVMGVIMLIMIVVAVGAMNVGLLGHY